MKHILFLNCVIALTLVHLPVSSSVLDIPVKSVKGSQILVNKLDQSIPSEDSEVVIFQRKTNCPEAGSTGFFGLGGAGSSSAQRLKGRYCALISNFSKSYASNFDKKFSKVSTVFDLEPLASVLDTNVSLKDKGFSKRFIYLIDWNAAPMDEGSKYFHFVFEVALIDTAKKRWVWHSVHSDYGLTDSYGRVDDSDLSNQINMMLLTINREIALRSNYLDLKLINSRLLSDAENTQQDIGVLHFINDYFDSGYNTSSDYFRIYKLDDIKSEIGKKVDAYISLPKYSRAKIQLEPGFYAVGVGTTDPIKVELLSGKALAFKLSRGLLNRSVLDSVNFEDLSLMIAKFRNGFFPDSNNQKAFLNQVTWQSE